MDCTNTDIFSPIRNFDDEKNKRQSDGFSEFLKGPVSFKKKSAKSEISENANKNMPAINISSPKSRKTLQKKTSKFEIFSPIHNSEEKTDRPSDGLSEFLKGPDGFKKKSVMSEILENVNENIPVSTISRQKSSKTHQKKTPKSDIFSPIRNFDEKIERQSDGFSEFLKGPDSFKKKSTKSDILKNADENILVDISSQNSSKMLQNKVSLYEAGKREEELASPTSLHNSGFIIYPEKIRSSKQDRPENVSHTSKRNDKSRKSQQTKVESSNTKKSDSESSKKDASNLVKSSVQSGAVVASTASGSKEVKKGVVTKASESKEIKKAFLKTASESEPSKKAVVASSVTQRNPLPQMQSGALEKIINNAVESQVDSIRQSLWSHHLNTLKAINNIQDEMEQRRAENTTMFKIIEELLEENRLLRNAVLARQ